MKIIPLIAMTLLLGASGALAQPAPHRHGPPPVSPLVKALDSNTNGILEASEITNAPTALLTLDKNGDGKLSSAELAPQLPSGAPRGMRLPPDPLLKALDTNGDGTLDADEIANAAVALKKLDTNGDGQLSKEELRPARHASASGESGNDNSTAQGSEEGGQMPPPPGEGGPEGGEPAPGE